jgi:hypothetical protein
MAIGAGMGGRIAGLGKGVMRLGGAALNSPLLWMAPMFLPMGGGGSPESSSMSGKPVPPPYLDEFTKRYMLETQAMNDAQMLGQQFK